MCRKPPLSAGWTDPCYLQRWMLQLLGREETKNRECSCQLSAPPAGTGLSLPYTSSAKGYTHFITPHNYSYTLYFRIKTPAICGSSIWELNSHTLILVVWKGLLPLFVARSILLCVSFGPFIFWFYKTKWYNSETSAQGEKITYLQIRHICCHNNSK